ncbi:MAG: PD40 domain-containing protein [Oscillospiraceae bacterium]|nr:PD40 domain-containing protein [Oscillospiraceae bacterium]
MKTKKFRITAVLIILILLMLFFGNHRKLKIEEPMGKIVLNYLFSEDMIGEDPSTLVSVDPFTGTVSPISNIGTSPVRIMGNTSITLYDGFDELNTFNLKTKETKTVYETNGGIQSYEYVDETHVSVVEDKDLFLVNIEDGSKKLLVESVEPEHSWSSDGKMLYYASFGYPEPEKICVLNIDTGETKELFRGIYPKISKDGTKLAYFPDPGGPIKVRDLSNDKEWKINANYFSYFCFSPDGRFICTVEIPFILSRYRNVVKIWDYKTGASKTLLSSEWKYASSDLDWIE